MSYTKYDPDRSARYTRKSLRLSQHNYGWTGTYFITLHGPGKEPIFEYPELQKFLQETWKALPTRFPNVTLDEFVIMPDHIHFILHIEGNVEKPITLGQVVGAYKSLVAVSWLQYIKTLNIAGTDTSGQIWQRNYIDRIIHSTEELERVRKYIRDNPPRLLASKKEA